MITRSRAHLVLFPLLAILACGEGVEREGAEESDAGAMGAAPQARPGGDATGVPPGFMVRVDRPDRDRSDFRVAPAGNGFGIRTGPAGILYSEATYVTEGDYTVSARFTEVEAPPGHREGYGIFIGGADLEGARQRYTYFLVRADGRFLVKRRNGDAASNVTDGWKETSAMKRPGGQSATVTNELAIRVRGDRLHFEINGTRVTDLAVGDLPVHGIVGVRVNHNLRVNVEDFTVGM